MKLARVAFNWRSSEWGYVQVGSFFDLHLHKSEKLSLTASQINQIHYHYHYHTNKRNVFTTKAWLAHAVSLLLDRQRPYLTYSPGASFPSVIHLIPDLSILPYPLPTSKGSKRQRYVALSLASSRIFDDCVSILPLESSRYDDFQHETQRVLYAHVHDDAE